MSDLFSDLETVLNVVGWSALPFWARCVSATYALALVLHGNVAVVRNVWNASRATLLMSLRAGRSLATWWASPSRRIREQQATQEQLMDLTLAVQKLTFCTDRQANQLATLLAPTTPKK